MHRTTLDPDALSVVSFPTTQAPAKAIDVAKATRITSCTPPPYCTC